MPLTWSLVAYSYILAFRLNLSVTPPYNADFDGDEMNMQYVTLQLSLTSISQLRIAFLRAKRHGQSSVKSHG